MNTTPTPQTDAFRKNAIELQTDEEWDYFARQLERELAAEKKAYSDAIELLADAKKELAAMQPHALKAKLKSCEEALAAKCAGRKDTNEKWCNPRSGIAVSIGRWLRRLVRHSGKFADKQTTK